MKFFVYYNHADENGCGVEEFDTEAQALAWINAGSHDTDYRMFSGVEVAVIREPEVCGLCGKPGADKIPHPVHWPGEAVPETKLVHWECEDEECQRAHAALSDAERSAFLRTV